MSPCSNSAWLSVRTPRCRSIWWPSKVKFTSSTPCRSALAPKAASAPRRPPL
jgi:hypothetical protein